VYATDLVIHCGDLEIDWRKLWMAARVFQNNERMKLASTTSLNVAIEALEGANSFFTMVDLRLRAWGHMSLPYILLSISKDKKAPAVELVEKGLRPHERVPIRLDLAALRDNERLMKSRILKDRAAGNAFSFELQSIIMVFHVTRTFLATNPVDRIYAVLGLVSDIDVDDPNFRIDYSAHQTPLVVCRRFAAGLIKRGQGAAVLALAGTIAQACRTGSDFPSWVPDWTVPVRPNNVVFPMSLMMHGLKEQDELLYCAAGTSTMEARFQDENRTLVVSGARIDTVSCITQGELFAPPHLYENLILQLRGTGRNTEDIEDAIWKTLIANRTFDGHEPPPEYAAQYRIYKQRLSNALSLVIILLAIIFLISLPFTVIFTRMVGMKYIVLLVTIAFFLDCDSSPLTSVAATVLLRNSSILLVLIGCCVVAWRTWELAITYMLRPNCKWSAFAGFVMACNTAGLKRYNGPPECAEFLRSLLFLAGRYNLGITANGYIALLPLAARGGDEIVILKGGYAPLLLRRTGEGDYYKLVGESYVHGVMKGELFGDPKYPMEDICLI
jgi:hypothetical protein